MRHPLATGAAVMSDTGAAFEMVEILVHPEAARLALVHHEVGLVVVEQIAAEPRVAAIGARHTRPGTTGSVDATDFDEGVTADLHDLRIALCAL